MWLCWRFGLANTHLCTHSRLITRNWLDCTAKLSAAFSRLRAANTHLLAASTRLQATSAPPPAASTRLQACKQPTIFKIRLTHDHTAKLSGYLQPSRIVIKIHRHSWFPVPCWSSQFGWILETAQRPAMPNGTVPILPHSTLPRSCTRRDIGVF